MLRQTSARRRRALRIAAATGLALCLLQAHAHEAGEPLADPGFRPDSPYAAAFVESLGTARVAVYPTVLRRVDRTAHSLKSKRQVMDALAADGIEVERMSRRIDLGRLMGNSQWEVFQAGLERVAEALAGGPDQAGYHLVLEFLFPVSDDWIFGIECYVLDEAGNNVLSFLLNSHHRAFVEARLQAKGGSQADRAELHAKATRLAIEALRAQIVNERSRADRIAAFHAGKHEQIVFDDFEIPVPATVDEAGNAIGFLSLTDGTSTLEATVSDDAPPRPGASGPNRVLRLDMNGTGWAAFGHYFVYQGADSAHWTRYDWRAFDGISFWLYGQGTGAWLFVDLLDNRQPGSTTDDAERYMYMFRDDVAGWRLVSVPFAAFARKEIGNGAPADGLGLDALHGWALGMLATATAAGRPVTFFVDDFSLQYTPSPAGEGAAAMPAVDYPINELPMYGLREKTAEQERADREYIRYMTRGGMSREEAAENVARGGWNVFYTGDKAQAIRRFNQAWLLDPDNQLCLWGFAVTCADRGDWQAAGRYYRMAIEKGPDNLRLQRDYAIALRHIEKLERSAESTPAP